MAGVVADQSRVAFRPATTIVHAIGIQPGARRRLSVDAALGARAELALRLIAAAEQVRPERRDATTLRRPASSIGT